MTKASRWLSKARKAGLAYTGEAALDGWSVGVTHPTYAPKELPSRLIITTRGVVLMTGKVVLAAVYSDLVGLDFPGQTSLEVLPGVRVGQDVYRLHWPQRDDQRIRTGIINGRSIADGMTRKPASN